jgi:long-chain fatty acid transport protein
MKKLTLRPLVAALVLAAPVMSAWATDGYFSHGYGMKAKGMGGAAVASTDNAFAGANNPATSAFAGNRFEAGVDMFMPDRRMTRTAPGFGGMLEANVTSDDTSFLIPEFGYNRKYNDQIGYGISIYGNGGMNTNYAGGQTLCSPDGGAHTYMGNPMCGTGKLGVDLTQLIVAPTLAYKLDDRQSVGVSPLLIYQQFSAEGLDAFGPMSRDGTKLTNKGKDSSTGLGVRLGYFGKMNDKLSVGASYSPQTKMSKFSDYAGLFANQGSFDIPENYSIGLAFKATDKVSFAFDYQRINYSKVPAIGNSSALPGALGDGNGAGFGWSDVDVYKIGVEWQATPSWLLRAGYNKSTNPVSSANVSFNILAPGVITDHYTLGGTYAINKEQEVTFAYMYAPENTVSGVSMFDQGGGTVRETVKMSQQSLGIQFGWKF